MIDRQKFGPCAIQDGGSDRWILTIPNNLFRGLKLGPRDGDRRDTVSRLFAESIGKGSRPMWGEQFKSSYGVELRRETTDADVTTFVDIILQNQMPSKPEPPEVFSAKPIYVEPPGTNKSWWQRMLDW